MAYTKFQLPVGYTEFIPGEIGGFNFQLNRLVATSYARFEDMQAVAPKVQSFADWKREMMVLGDEALAEGRLLNAAANYRLAEFFAFQGDPDKELCYERFINLFYLAVQNDPFERHQVPYEGGCLPALRLPAVGAKKGVILFHGGYDSFKEEFYSSAVYMAERGYEVVLFEGPGQGAALHRFGLKLTPEWERPVKAVLDYFRLDNVTLVGVSLGGYLCLRAAAYEPRIKRVVAYDHFWGWGESMMKDKKNRFRSSPAGFAILKVILALPFLYRWMESKKQAAANGENRSDWVVIHGQYITGTSSSYEWLKHMMRYSSAKISKLVRQDVLVLAGEEDHSQPLDLLETQVKALKNARSVTSRVFTKAEQAHTHCQVGNLPLAMDTILTWIEQKAS